MTDNKIVTRGFQLFGFLVVVFLLFLIIKNQKELADKANEKPRIPIRIGGCAGTRYGCCPNGRTPKANYIGTNC